MFKSLELDNHNIQSDEKSDLQKVNRWAGFSIGTNNLSHLEQNLQVLTRGKSENIKKYFNVEKLRVIANPNLKKVTKWQEKIEKRFEGRFVTIEFEELTKEELA